MVGYLVWWIPFAGRVIDVGVVVLVVVFCCVGCVEADDKLSFW